MEARDRIALACLVALFVATRLAWLVANPESAVYWEEAQRWMAAEEILGEPTLPWIEYQADDYQGGSLVMIALCLPFVALSGGASLAAFKLGALVFSAGTLCAAYACCRRAAGRSAGVLAGLGFVAGPPVVAYWGLVPFGFHQESTLFALLAFAALLRLLDGGRTPRGWFALGLIGGAGLWFCYTSGIALIACALTWLALERMPKASELGWAALGGAVGLAPWLAYNVGRGFVGLARIGHLLGLGDPINYWARQSIGEKLAELLARDLPLGLLFPFEADGAGLGWLAIPFAVPLATAFVVAARGIAARRERPLELGLLLYAAAFTAVYLASAFSVEPDQGPITYRLFLPLATLAVCQGALVAARALRGPGWRRSVAAVLCGSHLAASAAGTAILAARVPDEDQHISVESGYFVQGLLMYRKYEDALERPFAYARALPTGKLRNLAWVGIGLGLEYRFEKSGTADGLDRRLRRLEPHERTRVLTGIYSGIDFRRASLEARRAAGRTPERDRVIAERLDALERMVDGEADRIPDRYWPLGGNRRSPAPRAD